MRPLSRFFWVCNAEEFSFEFNPGKDLRFAKKTNYFNI